MNELGYKIKYGKHISFKPKDKARFTRAKTIGEDYTEERLKEHIAEISSIKTPAVKKRIGNVIDMNTNVKVKESNGYEYWAAKHNLKPAADTVILMRELGFKSLAQLDNFIKESAEERQSLQDKIKVIDSKISTLSSTMEQVHRVTKYRQICLTYNKESSDKAFYEEYKSQIILYQNAIADLKNLTPNYLILKLF